MSNQNEPSTLQRAYAWLDSRDTGLSSMTIWFVMLGHTPRYDPSIPYDPADFGRCFRLFEAVPEWRARLGEMAEALPFWKPFVENWERMETLYREELPSGKCPELYALMTELVRESQAIRAEGKQA